MDEQCTKLPAKIWYVDVFVCKYAQAALGTPGGLLHMYLFLERAEKNLYCL